ncbi:non-structural maintenance of chromosomes element 3 homolog isoform X1 [Alligator mississippiensis]|uniref:non-structural maintenance of chromosomes element 3 homolog isoform X1 n=1 Tax=Alligator mississippiensis TaxID=8496 RepID=UPI000711B119|nr:non-structural maintenance of chromosomes element 3 homolog isoform X1 [Alligator mississippiensis]XP_019333863.2 non-structural maintenance of chromosomes element 3 homolog isoform X1 [Alligator mississippiensis]XP_019333864.1 non-structural maintenance of chromosomes element 3 homolog isoform X1 [Alligator mississippiensis]
MSQKHRKNDPGPSQADARDEDFVLTPSQMASQVQRNLERRSQGQVDQKVSELVQFLLVKDQKKIPIKRADILKKVIGDYRDVYPEIVNRAGWTLQKVFGLELKEMDTKPHMYILVSTLPRLPGDSFKQDNRTAKLGLLTIILSFIFMKGNSVKEVAVWEMLRRLRVACGESHEVFGDVKKLVTEEFVRQKYLEYLPIPHTDPTEFKLQWGGRATKETSKRHILQFVAKIQNKDPQFWTSQFNEAEKEAASAPAPRP